MSTRTFADPSVFEALLSDRLCVHCEVPGAAGDNTAFRHTAPMKWVASQIWFKRSDVNDLPCDDAMVQRVEDRLKENEQHAERALKWRLRSMP